MLKQAGMKLHLDAFCTHGFAAGAAALSHHLGHLLHHRRVHALPCKTWQSLSYDRKGKERKGKERKGKERKGETRPLSINLTRSQVLYPAAQAYDSL